MDRRQFLAIAGMTAFVGNSKGENVPRTRGREGGLGETPTETPSDPDTTVTDETTADASDAMEFSGSGSEVIRDVELDGGLTVVTASHDGSSNFQVQFVPLEGDFDELFVNEIGEYEGTSAELIEAGMHLIDVEADGDWELRVTQPRPTSGSSLPATIEGDGSNVYGPFEFSGVHIATASHDGERNFIVRVLPLEDSFGELVFNEIGMYEGETAFRLNGIGFVDVAADGAYEIAIEES